MDAQDIFSGLDPSYPQRVGVDEPIFKPFGNPIALVMEMFCLKTHYLTIF